MEKSGGFDWLTAGQFLFSISVVVLTTILVFAGSLLLVAGSQALEVAIPQQQIISSFLFLAGLGFIGLLLVPSVITSGRALLGLGQREISFLENSWWLLLFVPLLIAGSSLLTSANFLQVAAFAFIHLATNGAVTFWMIFLLRRNLPKGSSQRFWGILGSGVSLAPGIAFVVELILLVLVIILWLAYLQTQPAILEEIHSLLNRLPQSAVSPVIIERMAGKYLARPGVLGTIFVYVAVLIPVVEELIKPIGVWFLLSREISAWEGFVLGGLAGAGYGLFENLTIGANADVWMVVVISRIGTTAIHIFTSGLVGWGLVSAWKEARYLRLGKAYLSAVLLHGVWNGLNVLNLIPSLPGLSDGLSSFTNYFAGFAPAGLIILSLGALLGIIRYNIYFRRAEMS